MRGLIALTLRSGSVYLHCINPAAMAIGLSRGLALADAPATCPDLAARPADLAREAAALASLRRWASRNAPMVASGGPDGLMADTSGVPHLFGGKPDLREDLHALARHGGGITPDG